MRRDAKVQGKGGPAVKKFGGMNKTNNSNVGKKKTKGGARA